MTAPPICPECAAGKCGNCDGTALDPVDDMIVECDCHVDGHPSVEKSRALLLREEAITRRLTQNRATPSREATP